MKKTKYTQCFKMPNVIADDTQLTYSAKVVAGVLYACRNQLNYCRMGLAKLSRYSGCSVDTVRKALIQLTERGYISIYRNYAWCAERGRIIFRKDTIICRVSTSNDFTFIPRATLRAGMHKSSFAVLLCICRMMGNKGRAFPSLRKIADKLMMGLATVCRALQELCKLSLIHKEHCVKRNGSHASNSYFLLRKVTAKSVEKMDIPTTVHSKATLMRPTGCKPHTIKILRDSCAFRLSFSDLSINYTPPTFKTFPYQGVLSFLVDYNRDLDNESFTKGKRIT